MYPMMKYCYEHDAWMHTDKYLKASLLSSDQDWVHRCDGVLNLKVAA